MKAWIWRLKHPVGPRKEFDRGQHHQDTSSFRNRDGEWFLHATRHSVPTKKKILKSAAVSPQQKQCFPSREACLKNPCPPDPHGCMESCYWQQAWGVTSGQGPPHLQGAKQTGKGSLTSVLEPPWLSSDPSCILEVLSSQADTLLFHPWDLSIFVPSKTLPYAILHNGASSTNQIIWNHS